jgi:Cytochrome c oxidase subunit III
MHLLIKTDVITSTSRPISRCRSRSRRRRKFFNDFSRACTCGRGEADQGLGELFWVFYWVATGLHAIHLASGIGLVLYMLLWRIRRGEITPAYYAPLEVVGIYWSFVDAVWLFLYPSIYLVGRS